jgi:hypothetical protein
MLTQKMRNGATVSDWLGTAMVAARMAASHLEAVREGRAQSATRTLVDAERELLQAVREVREVLAATTDCPEGF